MLGNRRKTIQFAIRVVLCLTSLDAANAQSVIGKHLNIVESGDARLATGETPAMEPIQEALRSARLRMHPLDYDPSDRNTTIVIGFVGGFVKHNDLKHPEVHFAAILRDIYSPSVHIEVFANHDGKAAFRRVLELLDSNRDGVLTPEEKGLANIIVYGHSWGGSQTLALTRDLELQGIPVTLTIQIDSVRKFRQNDSIIPPNVKNAINFYQTESLIHGQSKIRAKVPERTHIVGNFRMDYRSHHINCANYPWVPRHFNKGHHEIENDPEVWNQIASLIDSQLGN